MSFESEGRPDNWDEIKAASRKLDWAGTKKARETEKRVARRYLAHIECEDTQVTHHIAIPGYN